MSEKKIALVDIDNCFVSNETSELNQELIKLLKDGKYSEIWFFSGRNGNDSWQHVLKRGFPHKNWKDQLIASILTACQTMKLNITGVSLPYDHVYECGAGKGYKQYKLADLEAKMLSSSTLPSVSMLSLITQTTSDTDEDMCLQLALRDDTSKVGQATYLLNHLFESYPEGFEVDYFDDKKENLDSVANTVAKNFSKVIIHTHHVDFTHGVLVNNQPAAKPNNSSSSSSPRLDLGAPAPDQSAVAQRKSVLRA
jgi:hypothetical protein